MKKNIFLAALFLIFIAGECTLQAQQLAKIKTYTAPPLPDSDSGAKETYDWQIASKKAVPATLTDVFIWDVWQRVEIDLKLKIKSSEITEELVNTAFDVYLKREWGAIAGYRPWTHLNFIRSLTSEQRKTLATEVVAYIKASGIKEVK